MKNPKNPKEFISPEVTLPREVVSFKFLRCSAGKVEWESLPSGENHCVYLSHHKLVHIDVREGRHMVVVRADLSSAKKPEIPTQQWDSSTDLSEISKFTADIEPTGDEELIVATFELPLTVEKRNGRWVAEPSNKLLYPSLYRFIMSKYKNAKWVGYVNIPDGVTKRDVKEIEKLLNSKNCVPVYLDKKLLIKFRNYCEEVLYPFIHNLLSPNNNLEQVATEYWAIYRIVNDSFANAIIKLCSANPMIWINDVYLLMCPFMIVRKNVTANIGLFLHSSFPSREIYKVFPYREEILTSMLCCNLIGFHVFPYARNFFLSCQCILGLSYQMQ